MHDNGKGIEKKWEIWYISHPEDVEQCTKKCEHSKNHQHHTCVFQYSAGKIQKGLSVLIALSLLFSCISYAYVANLFGLRSTSEYIFATGEGIEIEIPSGSSTKKIAEVLYDKKIIGSPFLFKLISRANGYDGLYKSGIHLLSYKMSYEQIMSTLVKKPKSFTITIPEGYNVRQILEAFAAKKPTNVEALKHLMDKGDFDFEFLKEVPMRANRLEGYLYPDTYEFGIHENPEVMVTRMLNNFNKKLPDKYQERAAQMNLTMDDIIKVASIVEREAYKKEEKKKIAGVFYNRLKSRNPSMTKLQSCATIEYILFMRNGNMKEKLSQKDTQIEDPYNTYIFPGLPPGPICSPGLDSIEASLYPEVHEYYYFVAKPDKSHAFAKTYAEHLQNEKKAGG